jgi:YidC/Oxa1 family membrane protein insertase
MDNKNVFIAIALSMSVLLFWGAFFETPEANKNENSQQLNFKNKGTKDLNNITPNISQEIEVKSASREKSISEAERVKVENKSIVGSISLKGALIDDISFKNHKQNLDNNKNVEFLNPRQSENGYFIETGWTSIGNKIKVPTINSKWSIIGNNLLTSKKPIKLEWNNGEGIIFKKEIIL